MPAPDTESHAHSDGYSVGLPCPDGHPCSITLTDVHIHADSHSDVDAEYDAERDPD